MSLVVVVALFVTKMLPETVEKLIAGYELIKLVEYIGCIPAVGWDA